MPKPWGDRAAQTEQVSGPELTPHSPPSRLWMRNGPDARGLVSLEDAAPVASDRERWCPAWGQGQPRVRVPNFLEQRSPSQGLGLSCGGSCGPARLRGSPPGALGCPSCERGLFSWWVCLFLPRVRAWEPKFYGFGCLPHKLTYVIIHYHVINYNVPHPISNSLPHKTQDRCPAL